MRRWLRELWCWLWEGHEWHHIWREAEPLAVQPWNHTHYVITGRQCLRCRRLEEGR